MAQNEPASGLSLPGPSSTLIVRKTAGRILRKILEILFTEEHMETHENLPSVTLAFWSQKERPTLLVCRPELLLPQTGHLPDWQVQHPKRGLSVSEQSGVDCIALLGRSLQVSRPGVMMVKCLPALPEPNSPCPTRALRAVPRWSHNTGC